MRGFDVIRPVRITVLEEMAIVCMIGVCIIRNNECNIIVQKIGFCTIIKEIAK